MFLSELGSEEAISNSHPRIGNLKFESMVWNMQSPLVRRYFARRGPYASIWGMEAKMGLDAAHQALSSHSIWPISISGDQLGGIGVIFGVWGSGFIHGPHRRDGRRDVRGCERYIGYMAARSRVLIYSL